MCSGSRSEDAEGICAKRKGQQAVGVGATEVETGRADMCGGVLAKQENKVVSDVSLKVSVLARAHGVVKARLVGYWLRVTLRIFSAIW